MKQRNVGANGEMAERFNAAVLKTVEGNTSGGSNPSLSANKGVNQKVIRFTPFITPKKSRYFLYGLLRYDVRESILTYHSELLE